MPYANIHWIKLQLELLNDKRFIFDCNNDQKWLYVGLLLLAGSTKNSTPNDENFIKNRLNLPENNLKIRENLDFLLKTFPKMVSKNGIIKFKNFNALHNRIGKSEGSPEELQRGVQIRKEQIEKIREEYVSLKGLSLTNYDSNDFARTGAAIKKLILRAGDDKLVLAGLKWQSEQNYEWTLETLLKKWADFMKYKDTPEILKKYSKDKK